MITPPHYTIYVNIFSVGYTSSSNGLHTSRVQCQSVSKHVTVCFRVPFQWRKCALYRGCNFFPVRWCPTTCSWCCSFSCVCALHIRQPESTTTCRCSPGLESVTWKATACDPTFICAPKWKYQHLWCLSSQILYASISCVTHLQMCQFVLAGFETPLVSPPACLPVFLSSLRAVSYAVRLSQSQQCAADTEEKERRPSGLGHTVAATTRDAARTPLQTIITVRVGRNNDNSYGNVSPLCL